MCETFTSQRQEVEFILEKPQSIIAKSLVEWLAIRSNKQEFQLITLMLLQSP
jgi:hypothetical protein